MAKVVLFQITKEVIASRAEERFFVVAVLFCFVLNFFK